MFNVLDCFGRREIDLVGRSHSAAIGWMIIR
jgi:hypothetical protein